MTNSLHSELPTERSFGFLFTAVFAALAAYGVYKTWPALASGLLLAVSAAILGVTFVAPSLLAPLNRAWFQLGQTIGKIVSPVVLGVIFFGLLTPIAFIGRLMGRDELHLKRPAGVSYWKDRTPPGPDADSFKNQF